MSETEKKSAGEIRIGALIREIERQRDDAQARLANLNAEHAVVLVAYGEVRDELAALKAAPPAPSFTPFTRANGAGTTIEHEPPTLDG
jgi:hypothetical protein